MKLSRPILLGIALLSSVVLYAIPGQLQAQSNNADNKIIGNPRDYFASYYLTVSPLKGFDEFKVFVIEMPKGYYRDEEKFQKLITPDPNGYIPIKGELIARRISAKKTSDITFKFIHSGFITREGQVILSFDTKTIDGVSYSFNGQYYETGRAYPEREAIRLKGKFIKFRDGSKLEEADVILYPNVLDID